MEKLIVLFLLIATALGAAKEKAVPFKDQPRPNDDVENRITNGYPAYEGKAPYTVGLSFRNGVWCGGTIIGHNWVLTAAHCTDGAEGVTINYGSTWRTKPHYTHSVDKRNIILHHAYNRNNLNNDISLIRTPHVDFWKMVNKANLPRANERSEKFENWWAVTCGWGGTTHGNGLPDWLQCADLQIMENWRCQQTYGTDVVFDGTICVRTPGGKSTCFGDSGGPLVTHDNPRLVGVTSFVASTGCQSGAPAGFTRVTYYLDWIRENTGISY